MVDLEDQEFCCLFPPLLLPGNSSRLVRYFPSYFKYGVGFEVFSKECELSTRAELRVLPFLPPFLPRQAVKSSKVRPAPYDSFFFLDSSAFAGLDGVRGSVSCSWHRA